MVISRQYTIKQAKINLANTQEYHQAHTVKCMATVSDQDPRKDGYDLQYICNLLGLECQVMQPEARAVQVPEGLIWVHDWHQCGTEGIPWRPVSSGELVWSKKDCFYAGYYEHYKYLVSHLKEKEKDDCDPIFMLKEIQENDES